MEALEGLFGEEAAPHAEDHDLEVGAPTSDSGDSEQDAAVERQGGGEVGDSKGPWAFLHGSVHLEDW